MTTIVEARFQIEARLVELAAGTGRAPMVDQVEAEIAGDDLMVFVFLVDDELNGGCPLCTCVEWDGGAFDEDAFIQAFWASGAPSLARH